MRNKHRIISLLLTFIIAISLFPTGTLAESIETEKLTDGVKIEEQITEAKPVQIAGGEEAAQIAGSEETKSKNQETDSEILSAISANIVPQDILADTEKNISRGEFCGLIAEMLNRIDDSLCTEDEQKISFADVSENSKYYDSIMQLADLGIVSGCNNSLFSPEREITKQEAAVIIKNVADLFKIKSGVTISFDDEDEISEWALDAVNYVTSLIDSVSGNRIMTKTDENLFEPQSSYTRAQAIASVMRLYNIVNCGVAAESYIEMPYADVEYGSEYYDAVLWLSRQNITTQEDEASGLFRPDDDITMGEYFAMLVSIYVAPSKYYASGYIDNRWDDLYITTASLNGLTTSAEFWHQGDVFVSAGQSTLYYMDSFDQVEYRAIWAFLDKAVDFDFYPVWFYDGSRPRSVLECYDDSLKYLLTCCGWVDEGISFDTIAKRGDVALLLYRAATEEATIEEPILEKYQKITQLNFIDDGTSKPCDVRIAEWGCYYGLTMIPEKYIDMLIEKGYRIIFTLNCSTYYETAGYESPDPDNTAFAGIHTSAYKIIGIITLYKWNADITIVHEVAHAIRYVTSSPTTTVRKMLFYMYDIEGENLAELYRNYCLTDEDEMFAEAFTYVVYHRNNSAKYKTMLEEIPYSLSVVEQVFLDSSDEQLYDFEKLKELYAAYEQ